MKKRTFLLLAIFALGIAVFLILKGNKNLKKETVIKASVGIKSRKFLKARCIDTVILKHEAYYFTARRDTIFYTVEKKSSDLFYAQYKDEDVVRYSLPDSEVSICAIQSCGKTIWVYDSYSNSLIGCADGRTIRHRLPKGTWRGIICGDNIIYLCSRNGGNYFFSLNLITNQLDSINAATIFKLPEEDMDIKISGYFYKDPKDESRVFYQPTKSSIGLSINALDIKQFILTRSIDSLGFPDIQDRVVSEGFSQKVPVPEIYIDISGTADEESYYLLSRIYSDTVSRMPVVDVYSRNTNKYMVSYDLGYKQMHPLQIFLDPEANKLWVLYNDNRTLISYTL